MDSTLRLRDGSAPLKAAEFLDRLTNLGVSHTNVAHPPVYTVEESKALRGRIDGHHTKNLFLRDRKGKMWLVTLLEDRVVDLKELGRRLGAKHVSFASAERLMGYLGVIPGAVTPFAVIHDREGAVEMVLDAGLLDGQAINAHPLDNGQTTTVSRDGFLGFLDAERHPPRILDFESVHGETED